jgi:glycosyltransferase involved in cell wall biosynthesis
MKVLKENSVFDPEISVILPVYNGERFLKKSIESILSQTHKNFELIIADDGSTDGSSGIINSFDDHRISHIEHQNQGLGSTLNSMINFSRAPLIARQDQDDISVSGRLEKQVDVLKEDTSIVLVGSWARIINENGNFTGRCHKHPSKDDELRFHLLFDNPFVHSAVLFRRQALAGVGFYCSKNSGQFPEDFDLWQRLSRVGKIRNIQEFLLNYRSTKTGMSGHFDIEKRHLTVKLCLGHYKAVCCIDSSDGTEKLLNIYHRVPEKYAAKIAVQDLLKNFEKIECKFSETNSIERLAFKKISKKIKIELLKSFYKQTEFSSYSRAKALFCISKEYLK